MKVKMSMMLVIFLIVGLSSVALMAQDEGVRDETRPSSAFGDMVNAKRQRGPTIVLCGEITGALLKGVKARKKSMKNGVTITFTADQERLNVIKEALEMCKENGAVQTDPKAPKQLIGMKGVSVKLSESEGALSLEAYSDDKRITKLIKSVKIKAKAKKAKKEKRMKKTEKEKTAN